MAIIGCLVAMSLLNNLFEGVFVGTIDMEGNEDEKIVSLPVASPTALLHSTLAPAKSPVPPSVTSPIRDAVSSQTQPHALLRNNHSAALNNQSLDFTDRWCDLQRVDWYPVEPHQQWQQRAPSFLIPGAKFSGTSILSRMLSQHSSITPPHPSSETHFFLDGTFRRRYVTRHEKTLVYAARKRMWAAHYPRLHKQGDAISFDASPGYLFYSSLLPRRILCVSPWVKLVVLLRDPVDRIYHQFAASKKRGWTSDLETMLAQDFQRLERVGLVVPPSNNNSTSSVPTPLDISAQDLQEQEDLAWYAYHTSVGEGGPIGRSLYDIQLRQWFQALRAAGKDPATDVLIVWTERLAVDPAAEVNRILQFLQLPPSKRNQTSLASRLQAAPPDAINPATRQRLEQFFDPYNRRLEALLAQYGVALGKEPQF
jgi:hypothetical protein